MKSFKEFDIKPQIKGFVGDKIKIERLLNRQITIHAYSVVPSKFKGECLNLQIEVDREKRVVFTASRPLIDMIKQVPESEFPFLTTIVKETEWYEFS